MKRLLTILLVIFCCSCSTGKDEPEVREEYIAPIRDVFIFAELDRRLQEKIRTANNEKEFNNYQLRMLFKDIYPERVEDINGRIISLKSYDRLILEVVSTNCNHCRNQLSLVEVFSGREDVQFVQYFNVGDSSQIREFYEEAGVTIPDNVIIIPHNDELKDYFLDELELELYPTMLAFSKGKLQFDVVGEIDEEDFARLYDISFVDPLQPKDFLDEHGNDIISRNRTIEDVRDSLSKENLRKLEMLDADGSTMDLTLSVMGKRFDFTKTSGSDSKIYYREVSDFGAYRDKKLIAIYTYLKDESETDKVDFINELIKNNEGYEHLVVLIEGMESSSNVLRKMKTGFACPVISLTADVPVDFHVTGIGDYPTALFIDRGVMTGVYAAIESSDRFREAAALFLSDESIAYQRNN